MSTRTTIRPHSVISAGNMASSSITSTATLLQSTTDFSYEVAWTGTSPVGTLVLQVSNSYALGADGSVYTAGTWTTVPMMVNGVYATSIAITGNSGNGFIDVTEHAGYATRIVYTRTSGTGTLTAIINGKVS